MIAHRDIPLDDVTMHCASAGSGDLVLFLHGFPEFWYMWRRALAETGRFFFAVAPDLRGFNLSSRPSGPSEYAIKKIAGDIKNLATELGYSRCSIVAHDWGGAAAWVFAMYFPDMLHKMVIINSPHPAIFQRELKTNPAQREASAYMAEFIKPDAEEKLSTDNFSPLMEMAFGDSIRKGLFTEEDRTAYIEAWSRPGGLTGGLNYYRAMAFTSEKKPINGKPIPVINTPTLVIWGEKDTALLASNLDGLERYVSDFTIHRVPDGSHWIVHEQPELIIKLAQEFLHG